jgi:hypothetical protein
MIAGKNSAKLITKIFDNFEIRHFAVVCNVLTLKNGKKLFITLAPGRRHSFQK